VRVQAAAVAAALQARGHQVAQVAADLDLADLGQRLAADRPDAVFNLVESLAGHGRLIHLVPSLLDACGVPLAGCPTEAIFLTSHKLLAKGLLRRAGLPTPDWLAAPGEASGLARGGGRCTAEQWIVKSVWEDASLGLDDSAVVDGLAAARALLATRATQPGAPWFAEAFIDGREFNLALLEGPAGIEVLPAAEMLFEDFPPDKPRIVGYDAKWRSDSFEYMHTVRRFDLPAGDGPLLAHLGRLAEACWQLCGLRGWARVDLRVDTHGRPWILEINANPCLAPDAGFAAALARAAIPFETAIARILEAAMTGAPAAPRTAGTGR
jgi:D-alanine-D-alanine ligase